jgi:hypothetical protein
MESAQLLKLIRAEINKSMETPGPEWKTRDQWGQEWGLKGGQTGRLLRVAIQSGLMETQKFRVPCLSRGSYPVPHFRQISNEK